MMSFISAVKGLEGSHFFLIIRQNSNLVNAPFLLWILNMNSTCTDDNNRGVVVVKPSASWRAVNMYQLSISIYKHDVTISTFSCV